jgi:glycosyltransferase involved in cell wall biosynthesis
MARIKLFKCSELIQTHDRIACDVTRKLIFVANHRAASRVADRAGAALAAGRLVELLAFDRSVVHDPVYDDPNITHTSLGPIRDGVNASRLYSLARAAWILARAARRIDRSDAIMLVNSLELLIICWLCGLTRLPTIYDVSDIHTMQLSRSWLGRALRRAERWLVSRHVGVMVVTSPWYAWRYYREWLKVDARALLIENKVPAHNLIHGGAPPLSNRIAWNGLLRCRDSARVLLECLKSTPDLVQLSLHGSLDRLGEVGRELRAQSNCRFTGPYQSEQISALLTASSFVWAIDLSEAENSQWLLPYRLYNAVAAGLPVIALDGTATAEVVQHYDIGLVLRRCTAAEVISALSGCQSADYDRWARNAQALSSSVVRQDEWLRVLDDADNWDKFSRLPPEPDVAIVLNSGIPFSTATVARPQVDQLQPALNADALPSYREA